MTEPATRSVSRGAWYSLALFTAAYFFSMLDRTILTLMVAPIQRDLGITDTQFSLLQGSTFAVFYLLGGVPIGWLVDRANRIFVVATGICLWSLATMASALAGRFTHLFLARICVGVGEASLNPSVYSLLSDVFPKNHLGRSYAIFSSGSTLGAGFAYAFGGYLIGELSHREAVLLPWIGAIHAWQLAFLIVGAPGVLLAGAVALRQEPRRRLPESAASRQSSAWRHLRHQRAVLIPLFAAFGCQTILMYAYLSWLPSLFVRVLHWSSHAAGIVMGVAVGVFGLLGFYAGGTLADRWVARGRRDAHLRVGLLALAVAVPVGILVAMSKHDAVVAVATCVFMFLLTSPAAAGVAGLQLLTPPPLRGRVSAIFMAFVNLAGLGLGPVVVALLTDYYFGSKTALDYSLAIVMGFVGAIAIAAFAVAAKRFAQSGVIGVNSGGNVNGRT